LNKSFKHQLKALKRKKLLSNQVVSLSEFRSLQDEQIVHRVVVVDDDESIRQGLKRLLEREGYHTLIAHDGMELARHLEATSLDLIFLDVDLPWVNGHELCQLIKSNPSLKRVPVVFISAHKHHSDIEKAFAAGCDDFIGKPFEVNEILKVIEKSLLKSS
jgi:CheY-like chemotaxis protein